MPIYGKERMMKLNRLINKTAIVTSSTKGIGLAAAKAFVVEGADVYLAVRNKELGDEIAKELTKLGPGTAKAVLWQAYDFDSYEPMVDEVIRDAGKIDILVNNFGGTNPKIDRDIISTDYKEFVKYLDVNVNSVFLTSNLVLNKSMVERKCGSIINIGSIAGITNDYKQCAYGVSKSGIIHLTKMIAVQTGRYNIRCNVVCPGMTATDAVTNNLTEEYQNQFAKATPLIRMATPEEIAAAITYFASDESAFTTGQVLSVEGGYSLAPGTYGDDIGAKAIKNN